MLIVVSPLCIPLLLLGAPFFVDNDRFIGQQAFLLLVVVARFRCKDVLAFGMCVDHDVGAFSTAGS